MGERVGDGDIYCGVAEDIMEYAGQMNAAAGGRSRRLLPNRPRHPVTSADADDPFVKVCRTAAARADVLVRDCVRCDLSIVLSGFVEPACPTQPQFEELKADMRAQLGALRSLNEGQ